MENWTLQASLRLVLLLLAGMTSLVTSRFFTSSFRMTQLAGLEEKLLPQLLRYDPSQHKFVNVRLTHATMTGDTYVDTASHPNGAYLLIKSFLTLWIPVFDRNPDFFQKDVASTRELPTLDDLTGALGAILRIQNVFSLQAPYLFLGNYSGYLGPPLYPEDAYFLGKLAFVTSQLNQSLGWLERAEKEFARTEAESEFLSTDSSDGAKQDCERSDIGFQDGTDQERPKVSAEQTTAKAVDKQNDGSREYGGEGQYPNNQKAKVYLINAATKAGKMVANKNPEITEQKLRLKGADSEGALPRLSPDVSLTSVRGLLGRVYLKLGDRKRAEEKYEQSVPFGAEIGDVRALGEELQSDSPTLSPAPDLEADRQEREMGRLCSRQKYHFLEKIHAHHRCRMKSSKAIPYLRYKEEILSVSPFVSVFYNVLSDEEMNGIIHYSKNKLHEARIMDEDGKGSTASEDRVGNSAAVPDKELKASERLSARVKGMTGLETTTAPFRNSSRASETLQVVNYGLGGHYSPHFDSFHVNPGGPYTLSGERIATFLVYMSEVELGGNTIFPTQGISVSPIKGAALFWYNYNPALQHEELTLHSACPVLKGHKWIANKWIWTYGNTFSRPCGSSPNATHLDVERAHKNDVTEENVISL